MTRSTRRQPGTQGVGGSVQVPALVVVCTSYLALPLLQVAGGGAQAHEKSAANQRRTTWATIITCEKSAANQPKITWATIIT